MEHSMRTVTVKTMQNQVKEFQVPSNIPISEFKQKIQEQFEVPPERQRLICKGKLLKDETSLNEYVQEDGQTVQLLIRSAEPEQRPQVQGRVPDPAPAQPAPPNAANNPMGGLGNLGSMIQGMMGPLMGGNQPGGSQGGPDMAQLMQSVMPMVQQMMPNIMQGMNPGAPQQPAAPAQPAAPSQPEPASNPPQQPSQPPVQPNRPPQQSSAPPQQRPQQPSGPPQQTGPQQPRPVPQMSVDPPPNRPQQPGPGHQPNPNVISLPFQNIQNIGEIVNRLSGPQSSFPPPVLPQLPVPRNPVVLLGGFMYNYQLQVLRLLPYLSRLADLCQRESLIQDPSHRQNVQFLSAEIGRALQELNQATQPVIEMLQNLQLGPNPGQFSMQYQGRSVVSGPPSQPGQPPAPPRRDEPNNQDLF